ncbi:hypothetical protein ACGRHY_27920 [Streptomyces sp. HK10]|uniref:hypothetical protein n=1 Tax=Streptomyces sp. HK10 TaxID=3373255 RepID=UPI0037490265
MRQTTRCGLRALTATGVVGALLTGCGGGGEAAQVPEGWGTLKTERLTVAYPQGFEETASRDGGPYEVARATLTEKGRMTASMTVEFDFGKGLNDADMAAGGAKARIQLGATPVKTTEIEVAGPGGREEARRIDYSFTFRGKEGGPPEGTEMDGVMLAGVDTEQRPYLITVNSVKGALSERDVADIAGSVELK